MYNQYFEKKETKIKECSEKTNKGIKNSRKKNSGIKKKNAMKIAYY